jgi:hypothetical protein
MKTKALPKPRKVSKHEAKFFLLWQALGGPPLEREYQFHPTRKWRFDGAHLPSRIAIELDGGVFSGGRHGRGSGFVKDAEKFSEAAMLGWLCFRLTPNMITSEWIQRIINKTKE